MRVMMYDVEYVERLIVERAAYKLGLSMIAGHIMTEKDGEYAMEFVEMASNALEEGEWLS